MAKRLLIASMPLVVCFVAVALAASDGGALAEGSAKTGAAAPKAAGEKGVFDFPLQRGQYIFIGYETGVKDKSKDDLGVEPISRNHILDKAVPEKWDMRIAVEPAPDEKGEKVWKTVMAWRASDADGSMYQRVALTWMLKVPAGKKVEQLPIEKVDASKEKGIDGLQFYKIPYAKVEDEVHYVLVAIGNKEDLFPKAITIPKKYPIFSWSNWLELK
jgi:hypothetical protein